MSQMGRPRKEIDYSVFEGLCRIQCTKETIAIFFGMDENTLNERVKEQYGETFSVVFEQKRKEGQVSLRQKQYQVAMKGNTTMLIWLGKNMLDQKDRNDVDLRSSDGTMTPKAQVILTLPRNGSEAE